MTKQSKGTIVEKVLSELDKLNKLPNPVESGHCEDAYCPNPKCGAKNAPPTLIPGAALKMMPGAMVVIIVCSKCGITLSAEFAPVPKKVVKPNKILTRLN